MSTSAAKPPILYAEDDENDAFLMQRAFNQAGIANPLRIVEDGRSAMQYLAGTGAGVDHQSHPAPCLILLDLKMPGQSGFDVLQWVRTQPATCTLPVIVLTSSSQDSDIHRAYLLGANGYLIKPGKPEELLAIVKSIKEFWLVQNRTPPPYSQLGPESKPR
jgi:CheY-like chemotaxis protein